MSLRTSCTVVTEFDVASVVSNDSVFCTFVTNWTSWTSPEGSFVLILFVGSPLSTSSADSVTCYWTGADGDSWTVESSSLGGFWTVEPPSLGGFWTISVLFKYSRPRALKT